MRVTEDTMIGTKKSLEKKEELVMQLKKIKFSENPKEYKRLHYLINKDRYSKLNKKDYQLNKEKYLNKSKEYRKNNREKIKLYEKEWYQKNKKHKRAYDIKYKAERVEHYKKVNREWRRNNREKVNAYLRNKRKNDINFIVFDRIRLRTLKVLKGVNKSKSTIKLLGCSPEELWKHLESKFQPGMTRENHGKWHIDHIRPCSSFDLTDATQQSKCFHYTNLQPLWAVDNLKKGAKYVQQNS